MVCLWSFTEALVPQQSRVAMPPSLYCEIFSARAHAYNLFTQFILCVPGTALGAVYSGQHE